MIKTTLNYVTLFTCLIFFISCSKHANQITVTAIDGLDAAAVVIKKGFVSINRKSDLELFNNQMSTVYEGVDKGNLKTKFGENDFLIFYNNEYYYSFRHFINTDFKSAGPKGHQYHFELFKTNEDIFVKVDIQGEEPMSFTKALVSRELAESYRENEAIRMSDE